jgi:hypothetical protein
MAKNTGSERQNDLATQEEGARKAKGATIPHQFVISAAGTYIDQTESRVLPFVLDLFARPLIFSKLDSGRIE